MSFDFIDVSLDKPFQEVNTSQKDNAMLLYVIKGQGEQRTKGYGQDSRIRLEVDSVQTKDFEIVSFTKNKVHVDFMYFYTIACIDILPIVLMKIRILILKLREILKLI